MKTIINFIHELSQLRHQVHTGWWKIGIKNPPTIAEHAFRAAQIAYVLAIMEGDVDPNKVASITMFHDNAETRIGDQDKVAARYFSIKKAESVAFNEQTKSLPRSMKEKLQENFSEYKNRATKESIISKDADWLEQAFQAKEYIDMGYKSAQSWIDSFDGKFKTKSAKAIFLKMKESEYDDWFEGLKK